MILHSVNNGLARPTTPMLVHLARLALAVLILTSLSCSRGSSQPAAQTDDPQTPATTTTNNSTPTPGSFSKLINGVGTVTYGSLTIKVLGPGSPEHAQRCAPYVTAIVSSTFKLAPNYTPTTLAQAMNAYIKANKPTRTNGADQVGLVTALEDGIKQGAFETDTFAVTYFGVEAVVDPKAVLVPPTRDAPITVEGTPVSPTVKNDSNIQLFCQWGCFTEKAMVKISPQGDRVGRVISAQELEQMQEKPIPQVFSDWAEERSSDKFQITPVLHQDSSLDDKNGDRASLKFVTAKLNLATADPRKEIQEVVHLSYKYQGAENLLTVTSEHPVAVWIRGEGAFLYRAEAIPELVETKRESAHLIHKSGEYVKLIKAVKVKEEVQAHHYSVDLKHGAAPLIFTGELATGTKDVQVSVPGAMEALNHLLSSSRYYPLTKQ